MAEASNVERREAHPNHRRRCGEALLAEESQDRGSHRRGRESVGGAVVTSAAGGKGAFDHIAVRVAVLLVGPQVRRRLPSSRPQADQQCGQQL